MPGKIEGISRAYGMGLEPNRPVWSLSAGERQRIEIARCLLQDPKVLILDEPTSVLTPQEAEKLFETLDRLKAEGRALLYISHHLEEVKRLCDRATILRLGKLVGTCDPRVETPRSLAALMVGSQIMEVRAAGAHSLGKDRLVVSNLDAPSPLAARRFAEGRFAGVHAVIGRPDGGRVRARAPPDAFEQPRRMGLEPEQTWRIGEHRARVRLGEAFAAQGLQKHLGIAPAHVGVALPL